MTNPNRPVDAKLRAQFESELAIGLPSSPRVSGRLQDATCKLVDELKARGFSIEEVIIAMHQMLAESGLSHKRDLDDSSRNEVVCLYERLITECIERYYT